MIPLLKFLIPTPWLEGSEKRLGKLLMMGKWNEDNSKAHTSEEASTDLNSN